MIHIWSDGPDIPIAAASSAGDAESMAKKRQPIDDLIDALMWMRRTSKRRARRSQSAACAGRHQINLGQRQELPLRIVTDRAERAEARYGPQSAAMAR